MPRTLLRQLPDELRRLGEELHCIAEQAGELDARLGSGMSWHDALRAAPQVEVTRRLSESAAALTQLAARLRRVKVLALKREGMTQDAIAQVFGVSRQRICAVVEQHRREQLRNGAGGDR